jgi:DNA-binding CsgD family transcriptional regulator
MHLETQVFLGCRVRLMDGPYMLQSLVPSHARPAPWGFIPPVLAPLVEAAESGRDLVPVIESITNNLGFETFTYGMSTSPRPDHESRMYVFTTASAEWVARYDQRAYIEVDPRILLLWDSTLPLVWDQRTVRGGGTRSEAFLDDALGFGIASGVCMPLGDEFGTRVMVALNSSIPEIDEPRRQAISRSLGDIVLLAHYFHELFMKSVVRRGTQSRFTGRPLSDRERECLSMAARGLTTDDIGFKLGIGARTVQFHFDSIRSKLAAANRQEAVARAIKEGIISL